MVLPGTPLEAVLAEAIGKTPVTIRYGAARLIAEFKLGRTLTEPEIHRLRSKISNSFPRDRKKKPSLTYWPKEPYDNFNIEEYDSGAELTELMAILRRAKI